MKNMRLSDLRKKKNSYFKKVKLNNNSSRKIMEYTVKRAFNALPSYLKKYIKEDKDLYIQNVINVAMVDGSKKITPYQQLKSAALGRSKRANQPMKVYRMFREMTPSVYSKYNSYMYRNGYSASQYFYSNGIWKSKGSIVEVTVPLPDQVKGIRYNYLVINLNFSEAGIFDAELV